MKETFLHLENFVQRYGPWAIVAGASEGLGAAFAHSLASRNINLLLIARRKDPLTSLEKDLINAYGVQIKIFDFDLADTEKLKDFVNNREEDIGLLVYNAALAPIQYFKDTSWEKLNMVADVNVKGPLYLSRWMSDRLLNRGRGGITLMSSLSGSQGSPKIAAYAASKSFNTTLAEGLWRELKPHGIDVVACCAGAIRTPGYDAAKDSKEAPGTMNARDVAEHTLKNLKNGPVVVPGKMNQFFRLLMGRILPRKRAIEIMFNNTKNLS